MEPGVSPRNGFASTLLRRTVPRRGVGDALRSRDGSASSLKCTTRRFSRRKTLPTRSIPVASSPSTRRWKGSRRGSSARSSGSGPAARLPGDRVFPSGILSRVGIPLSRNRSPHPLSARRRGRGALPGILLPPAAETDLRRTVRPPMGAGSPAGGDGAGGRDSASVGPRDRRRDQAPASVRPDGAQRRVVNEILKDLGKPHRCTGSCRETWAAARRSSPGSPRWSPAARRAGRGDGAHGDPRRAALPEIPGTVGGTAGPCRSPLRRAAREGAGSGSKADP